MSAEDHLSAAQFSEWYHGTSAIAARSIQAEGLTSHHYGATSNGVPYNPVLTTDRGMAESFARHRGGATVVTMHVPREQENEYLARNNNVAGLHKPLPRDMVHHVDYPDFGA